MTDLKTLINKYDRNVHLGRKARTGKLATTYAARAAKALAEIKAVCPTFDPTV